MQALPLHREKRRCGDAVSQAYGPPAEFNAMQQARQMAVERRRLAILRADLQLIHDVRTKQALMELQHQQVSTGSLELHGVYHLQIACRVHNGTGPTGQPCTLKHPNGT
jgi:hypothetical protein